MPRSANAPRRSRALIIVMPTQHGLPGPPPAEGSFLIDAAAIAMARRRVKPGNDDAKSSRLCLEQCALLYVIHVKAADRQHSASPRQGRSRTPAEIRACRRADELQPSVQR